MSSTYLPSQLFIDEVKRWGVTKDSLNKARIMRFKEYVYCKYTIPQTSEEIWTRILNRNQVQLEDLRPIAIPAIWINEGDELVKITKRLEQLEKNANNQNKPPSRN